MIERRETDPKKIKRLLGKPEFKTLLDRLQRGLELENLGETLSLTDLSPSSRMALESLLGKRPGQGSRLRIHIAELETVLRNAGAAESLADAVAVLRGPLRRHRYERDQATDAWNALFNALRQNCPDPQRQHWLDSLQGDGLLKRLSNADTAQGLHLLRQAIQVIERLPAAGLSLSQLAAQTLGNAHGLDAGQPVAALVRRYLRQLGHLNADSEDIEGERALWASAGILLGGGVTSRVLCLNLPAAGESASARMLRALAESGQPALLTLRQLISDAPAWHGTDTRVFICENPAVVAAAADRWGRNSAPLICTGGQPGTAVHILLQSLRESGAQLHYHGDFDWPGIGIANGLMARHPIQAWRFDAASYQQAPNSAKPLQGPALPADWDAYLAPAMQQRGMVVEEELIMEALLDDLAS